MAELSAPRPGERALDDFYDALLEDDAEQLYERAPCGYLSTTPDGSIIKVNQTFLNLTGYDRGELLGRRSFAELLSAGGRIFHETHYAPMLRMQGSAREIALDIVRADGTRLPVLVNAVLERDDSGAARVVRVAVFDATERREYERELLREKKRAEESETRARALAQTLQQTLIPPAPPHVPGLDVAVAYRPAGDGSEVGGDFYDVFQVGPQDWTVAIGDVCGKGPEAAVVTALMRYALRAAVVHEPSPAAALALVNDVLLHHATERFCTVGLLRLLRNDSTWTVVTSSGGHPPPLLVREGTVLPQGQAGSLVGVLDEPVFHDSDVELAPRDSLLLYTDGVTEGRHGKEFYGEARLRAAAAAHASSADALAEGVLADVLEFQHGTARDDIAVVALHVPG